MTDDKSNKIGDLEKVLHIPPEEMFAMFLHDLKLPVSAILACAEILSQDGSSERHQWALGALINYANGVCDLFDFAAEYLRRRKEIQASEGGSVSE